MKKLYFSLLAIVLVACSPKQTQTAQPTYGTDTFLLHVMQSILDTNRSILDVKDDLYRLSDTMLFHAQYHPDVDVRIGAKSLATTLIQLMLESESNSPDDIQFIVDSAIIKLTDVLQVWHAEDLSDYSILTQHIIRHRDNDDKNYMTEVSVYRLPDRTKLAIELPEDALEGASIAFGKYDNISELDTIVYSMADAEAIRERTDSTNLLLVFDDWMIDTMMSHGAMFIGYLNDQTELNVSDRHRASMMLLSKFHEQYPEFLKIQ